MTAFQVDIDDEAIRKAKAKAALLGITISDYVERIIKENTKNIGDDNE